MKNLNAIQKALYHYLYPACAIFSLSVFIMTIAANDTLNGKLLPTPKVMIWLWIFSLGFSALSNIFRAQKLSMFVRIAIHYVGTMLLFSLVFFAAVSINENWSGAMIMLLVLTILYFLIASVGLLIRSAFRRAESEDKKYKRQFNSAGL